MFVSENELDVGIERRAKLFEVGEYADKGVSVTRRDLMRLAANFDAPVPVLIEHGESPLRMGELVEVEPIGGELFGTLRLSSEANALIEQSGAKSLSLGLTPDLSAIREVSLVRHPRVATAQLFADTVSFVGGKLDARPGRTPYETNLDVDRLVKTGRIVPAQAPIVRALLAGEGEVEFAGEKAPIRALIESFLERQPSHALFNASPPSGRSTEEAAEYLMLPEEAAFYRKHFPDVPLELIAQRR